MTLADAQTQLEKWLAANIKVAEKGQALTIDSDGTSRTFTRADAAKILEQIKYWSGEVASLTAQAAATAAGNNGSQIIFAGRVR